jgi:predicted DCC family thiol-disulfide oxidoreductase YuxK
MRKLTILYDARCNLCNHIRSWIETQPSYLELEFVPAGSEDARQRFPRLDHSTTTRELTVIDDQGGVYLEANAFLMCLWALRDYRAWSLRLSAPELIPLARRVVVWVSQNRFRFGTRTLNEILDDNQPLPAECGDTCSMS